MRTRLLPLLVLLSSVFTITFNVPAQTTEVRYSADYGNALGFASTYESTARFDGSTIDVEVASSTLGTFSSRAAIADLDLEHVDIEEQVGGTSSVPNFFGVDFNCVGQKTCVQNASGEPGTEVGFRCNTRQECSGFVEAVRQAAARLKQNEAPSRQPNQAPSVPARLPAQAPSQPQPAAQVTSAAAVSALRDLIGTISWLNGAQGANSSTLDQLLKQIGAGKQPPPPPPPAKPLYAAFAQAGGFDANGAWGAATASDLNTAIASANGNCSKGARTSCDDEGYCVLRSGLWAAWASDLMVAGNSAFACNLKSQDEAMAQAQAWCGDACKVLWSGVGQ